VLESDDVKSFWKIAAFVSCVILICAAAITWQFVKARAIERKLAEDANLSRAHAEQGEANAQFKLARMFYLGKGVPQDYTEAVRWYRKAADQGYAKAQFNLSDMYRQGKGVPQDYAESFRWCRKAAEQGDTKGEDGIAFMFYQGQGVPQDYTEAVRWYRKAADQGDAMAQDGLGFMYYQGKGLSKDYAEAIRWCQKAADQGYPKAEYDLAYMYFQGKGVQRNYAEAARWFRKAAKQGDENSRLALAAMKIGFDTPSKIFLSIAFLGSMSMLTFQRRHSKSTTTESSDCWVTWPAVGGIGRLRALPFRHSAGAVGCQCFLLRQEPLVRNLRCCASSCLLAKRIQNCADNLHRAVHRIQRLRDDALQSQTLCGMPPRILFREWLINGNRDYLGVPSLAGGEEQRNSERQCRGRTRNRRRNAIESMRT
jgi:TPR repeat protein